MYLMFYYNDHLELIRKLDPLENKKALNKLRASAKQIINFYQQNWSAFSLNAVRLDIKSLIINLNKSTREATSGDQSKLGKIKKTQRTIIKKVQVAIKDL